MTNIGKTGDKNQQKSNYDKNGLQLYKNNICYSSNKTKIVLDFAKTHKFTIISMVGFILWDFYVYQTMQKLFWSKLSFIVLLTPFIISAFSRLQDAWQPKNDIPVCIACWLILPYFKLLI